MIRFIDRDKELDVLDRAWNSDKSEFIVLYGRRRVGKTTLLNEFFKNKSGIFYVAEDIFYRVQISDVKDVIAEFFNDEFLRNVTIESWKNLFEYLSRVMPLDKRFYLVLDEFTYLSKNDRTIITSLQKFWDSFLSGTRIFLAISGSDMGMVEDMVLSYSSPLYGRRTRDILLEPMSLKNSLKFLDMDFVNGFMTFMAIGGVPEYLLKASGYRDFFSFIMREFEDKQGYFYREPYFLLSQEFRNPNIYFSILNAISSGKNKPVEMANLIGVESKKLYPYIENLINLGFILRETPVTEKKNPGIYVMKDYMTEFWFNFVYPNREFIERGTNIRHSDYSAYFGRIFEKVIRNDISPDLFPGYSVGKWWYKDNEIDLVAVSSDFQEVIIGECKWRSNVDPLAIRKSLEAKGKIMLRGKTPGSIRYVIFAKDFNGQNAGSDTVTYDLPSIASLLKEN